MNLLTLKSTAMQLASNPFQYDYKEGKPVHLYHKGVYFGMLYCNEDFAQEIVAYLNQRDKEKDAAALEQQAANYLHNRKFTDYEQRESQ
jgi:hypothetical protein